MQQRAPKIFYTRREAADLLSISLRTIDFLIASGGLKSQRLGRRRLIARKSLEEFARRV